MAHSYFMVYGSSQVQFKVPNPVYISSNLPLANDGLVPCIPIVFKGLMEESSNIRYLVAHEPS